MRMRRIAAATAAALTVLGLLTTPGTAAASHSWGGYHWARTATPFTVELDNNLTSAWTSYLSTASSDWTSSSVLNTTIRTGSFGSRTSCTPASSHVEVCNAAYGSTGWLGIASISVTGGVHITSAYVKINDTYFAQAQYNTVPYKHLVMCQEVGHTFGLDHQDTNQTNANLGTCMDYTRNPAGPPSNEHPNAHDYAELETIYSHLDSTNTTLAPSGPSLAGTDSADATGAWGTRISGADRHGAATYARDLGNGTKVVTFVLWA